MFALIEMSLNLKKGPLKNPEGKGIILNKVKKMTELLQDSFAFFKAMDDFKVRYLLVGGWAVNYFGHSRATGDIDIWIEDTAGNRKQFIRAIKSLNIEGAELFADLPFLAGYTEIMLDNGIYIDLMANLQFSHKEDFNTCFNEAEYYNMQPGVRIPVISLTRLIEEKSKSKRVKDQLDAAELMKIQAKSDH